MRVPGWPQILDAKLEEWRTRAFAWGTSDCCQFVGEVAAALTGDDRRALFGSYSTAAEAAKIIADEGGMTALLTRAFGPPKPVARAHRGDVVLIAGEEGERPAICNGVHCFGPGASGLVPRKTLDGVCAWSVG